MQLSERVPEGECWIPSQPPINRGIRCNSTSQKLSGRSRKVATPYQSGNSMVGVIYLSRNTGYAVTPTAIPYQSGNSMQLWVWAYNGPDPDASQPPINRGIRCNGLGSPEVPPRGNRRNPLSIGEFDATRWSWGLTYSSTSRNPLSIGEFDATIWIFVAVGFEAPSQSPINRGIRCNLLSFVIIPPLSGRNPLSIGEFDGGGHSFSREALAGYDPHREPPRVFMCA